MIPDIEKIAALAMLPLTAEEIAHFHSDVGEILAVAGTMPDGSAVSPMQSAVPLAALDEDIAVPTADAADLLACSKKAENGYYTVSRTVGGSV